MSGAVFYVRRRKFKECALQCGFPDSKKNGLMKKGVDRIKNIVYYVPSTQVHAL